MSHDKFHGLRHIDSQVTVTGQDPSEVVTDKPPLPYALPTTADLVTLASYGLGLWWALGGPNWAGIASIVGDEVDGRLARATETTSKRGSVLDWGSDVTLTPLSLVRLGRASGHPLAAIAAAPAVLFIQADMRARGERPVIGSARAAIMLSAMVIEMVKNPR